MEGDPRERDRKNRPSPPRCVDKREAKRDSRSLFERVRERKKGLGKRIERRGKKQSKKERGYSFTNTARYSSAMRKLYYADLGRASWIWCVMQIARGRSAHKHSLLTDFNYAPRSHELIEKRSAAPFRRLIHKTMKTRRVYERISRYSASKNRCRLPTPARGRGRGRELTQKPTGMYIRARANVRVGVARAICLLFRPNCVPS